MGRRPSTLNEAIYHGCQWTWPCNDSPLTSNLCVFHRNLIENARLASFSCTFPLNPNVNVHLTPVLFKSNFFYDVFPFICGCLFKIILVQQYDFIGIVWSRHTQEQTDIGLMEKNGICTWPKLHVLASCLSYMSMLHVHAAFPCRMSMLHFLLLVHAACPFYMSLMHVHVACPCCILACPCCVFMLHVRASCSCCMSVLHVYTARLRCMAMLHVLAVCSCCMAILQFTAACPWYISVLHVQGSCQCSMYKVHPAASPWCMSVQLVHAACTCCISMLNVLTAFPFCISVLHPMSMLHVFEK